MLMKACSPRHECPVCDRTIAVVAGRYARHDPPMRGPKLLSCDGSLREAVLVVGGWAPHPVLFETDAVDQPALF